MFECLQVWMSSLHVAREIKHVIHPKRRMNSWIIVWTEVFVLWMKNRLTIKSMIKIDFIFRSSPQLVSVENKHCWYDKYVIVCTCLSRIAYPNKCYLKMASTFHILYRSQLRRYEILLLSSVDSWLSFPEKQSIRSASWHAFVLLTCAP